MPPRTSDGIRADFLEFWQAKASHLQASSSLIPYNDPTVLLTTAGMQQFVPYFLGKERSAHPRYVSVQKCFRTSDIDEVGDRSHLTFFEMLGNFSIGDYFKEEVIPWSLDFSTNHMGLDRERLWITIHHSDDEANAIWLKAGIPQERIKRFGDADNWWGPPGKTGPCGPNTELYYAQGRGFGCGFPGDPPGCDCGRLEYWNLVFMQFFQDEQGLRTPLPRKNVDTGMGIERATVVALGLQSIYDTDLFQPLVAAAATIAGVRYGDDDQTDFALRVLADHSRGMSFLVLDGVVPGPSGREYVLRRLARRTINYGRRLGIEGPFLSSMVDAVVSRMADHHPELVASTDRIKQVLSNEEELFSRTLQAGSAQIERLIAEATADTDKSISGARVFDLYQTFGFPVELTEELLGQAGVSFDRAEFERALESERGRARATARFQHERHAADAEFGDLPQTEFLAWTDTRSEARVLAVRDDRVILEASPFYPEGGGQVGDAGWIRTPGGLFAVADTRFDAAGHVLHFGHLDEGEIAVGDLARAEVDVPRRDRARRHHTATHLLHRALKDVLGEGTSQQGSYVGPDQLRFDFNYARPVSPGDLKAVASIINERGMDDLPVHWEIVDLDHARHMGAIMMFGEKYGEQVRVVSIGDYSKELCGGTHTHHSGELGAVVIASESGIGSGKRRIVAYAGQAALDHLNDRLQLLETIAERVGARTPDEVQARIDSMQEEIESLRKDRERRQRQHAHDSAASLLVHTRQVGGVNVIAEQVEHANPEDLAGLVDALRDRLRSGVVVLGVVRDGRVNFAVGVTSDLTDRIKAGEVVKLVSMEAGGGGGGQPSFAKGSGTQPARIRAALDQAITVVERALQ